MNATAESGNAGCEGTRALIAWYPTTELSATERRRVEAHVAGCTSCKEWLQFVSDLKTSVQAAGSPHPEADLLVQYAEDDTRLRGNMRADIARHVDVCRECAREVAILRAVDEDAVAAHLAPRAERKERGGLRALWETLAGSLLRPVPAAIYLTAAIVAVLVPLLYTPTDGPPSAPEIGSVVLLNAEGGGLRGAGDEEVAAAQVGANEGHFLLIEFLDLETPPDPAARYRVEIAPEGSDVPAWTGEVEGRAFIDNYTLCLWLDAGTLQAGSFTVTVRDPADHPLFRSRLNVR